MPTDEDYENYGENNAEAYYYDHPSDGYKSVIKFPKCGFPFRLL